MQKRNLFLIDGVAGSGKTDFFEFISSVSLETTGFVYSLAKFTSKDKGEEVEGIKSDLEYFEGNDEERYLQYKNKVDGFRMEGIRVFEYQYPKGKTFYGIDKNSIDNALNNYANVFLIIRSNYCIREIIDAYNNTKSVNVVPVFMYTDKELVVARLEKELNEKYKNDSIEDRVKKIQDATKKRTSKTNLAMDDFYTQPVDVYKEVVINNSNKTVFIRQMRALLDKYDIKRDPFNRVFMIIPMGNYRNKNVENVVKAAAKDVDFVAQCADDVDVPEQLIIEKVYEQIKNSDVCIADLTHNRPNCYLEVGYARALNKKVVLIAKRGKNEESYVHFDEQGYEIYYYDLEHLDLLSNLIKNKLKGYLNKNLF